MHKRRSSLPNPRLQLKMILLFICTGLVGLIAQYVFTLYAVFDLEAMYPDNRDYSVMVTDIMWHQMLVSACFMVPLTLSAGIVVTHRVAGPTYRFTKYLRELTSEGFSRPCSIRDGDEFGELCEAINTAVASLRQDATVEENSTEPADSVESSTPADEVVSA